MLFGCSGETTTGGQGDGVSSGVYNLESSHPRNNFYNCEIWNLIASIISLISSVIKINKRKTKSIARIKYRLILIIRTYIHEYTTNATVMHGRKKHTVFFYLQMILFRCRNNDIREKVLKASFQTGKNIDYFFCFSDLYPNVQTYIYITQCNIRF